MLYEVQSRFASDGVPPRYLREPPLELELDEEELEAEEELTLPLVPPLLCELPPLELELAPP